MLSRKSKDKTSKTGLAGKYIKKDTVNPEIKRKKFHNYSADGSIMIFRSN